jgi:hypothetical protein
MPHAAGVPAETPDTDTWGRMGPRHMAHGTWDWDWRHRHSLAWGWHDGAARGQHGAWGMGHWMAWGLTEYQLDSLVSQLTGHRGQRHLVAH